MKISKIFLLIFLLIAIGSTVLYLLDLVAIATILFLGGVVVSVLLLLIRIVPRMKDHIKDRKRANKEFKKDQNE